MPLQSSHSLADAELESCPLEVGADARPGYFSWRKRRGRVRKRTGYRVEGKSWA